MVANTTIGALRLGFDIMEKSFIPTNPEQNVADVLRTFRNLFHLTHEGHNIYLTRNCNLVESNGSPLSLSRTLGGLGQASSRSPRFLLRRSQLYRRKRRPRRPVQRRALEKQVTIRSIQQTEPRAS